LVADFIAPLITVALPFAAVVNSFGTILRQILPGGSWPTGVWSHAASGSCTDGGTAERCSGGQLRASPL
jgi:hypothetical protein